MHLHIDGYDLRKPEPRDAQRLYCFRNNPEVTWFLRQPNRGFAIRDIEEWIERHRVATDEALWVIAGRESDECVGQIGLYRIDHRLRSAELGILIGDPGLWGQGLGRRIISRVLRYGFSELYLHRIYGYIVAEHKRSLQMVASIGFKEEGLLRDAHLLEGRFVDLVPVAILDCEYQDARDRE